MTPEFHSPNTRRDFFERVAQLGVVAAVTGCASQTASSSASAPVPRPRPEWDLSWVPRVAKASDRAVFDAPAIGSGTFLDLATRYLDNCDAVYGRNGHSACVVLNIRTRAVALALSDELWSRYALGAEYDVKDPQTKLPATQNPYREVPPGAYPGTGALNDLVKRGAVVLVCDFALGHLSTRLATKGGRPAEQVHAELRAGFIPGAIAVPSGIYGLAKAQNAGCGLVAI